MNHDQLLYKLAMIFIPGIGPVLGKRLISYAGGVENVFQLSPAELQRAPGIGDKLSNPLLRKKALNLAKKELENLQKYSISAHFYLDKTYPEVLKNFEDAPIILFTKGSLNLDTLQPKLAIVGTRKATAYGRQACEKIIRDLVNQGVKPIIISGLAYGIDHCAHKISLELNLPNIAVLANGLNTIYPATHKNLALKIQQNGLIISENPTLSKLEPKAFVRRNRIIAALADATIIIESGLKGGAMFTAQFARHYAKKVYALPGRINDPKSQGPNWLIKQNKATILTSAQQIIEDLNWKTKQQIKIEFPELSSDEQKVIQTIKQHDKIFIDDLALKLGWNFNKILTILFQLELKGLIEQLPGNFYTLKII